MRTRFKPRSSGQSKARQPTVGHAHLHQETAPKDGLRKWSRSRRHPERWEALETPPISRQIQWDGLRFLIRGVPARRGRPCRVPVAGRAFRAATRGPRAPSCSWHLVLRWAHSVPAPLRTRAGAPVYEADERLLAQLPTVDVPTIVLDPTEDPALHPRTRRQHEEHCTRLLDHRLVPSGHNQPTDAHAEVARAVRDVRFRLTGSGVASRP